MDDKKERLHIIQDMLKKQNVVTIREFAKNLGTSEMTVRRDLQLLKDRGLVNIFYGGVSLRPPLSSATRPMAYDIDQELGEKSLEKKRIARKAASLVMPNDVLLIDTGSTTSAIIDFIPAESRNIVYCYALNIIQGVCAMPNLSVVACGGFFHRNTRMFESEEGATLIRKTRINKAFMATRGVTADVGVTTAESYEIDMKKAAMSVSEQKILLVDSSKMGKAWYARYARLEEFDIVITDSGIENRYAEMIRDMDIQLHIV
jgi:DeoR family deoxyribose operon repressor